MDQINLNTRFKQIIKKDQILIKGTKFLVAVSGGLDSMCLLTLVSQLDLNQRDIFVVYVNHSQREESLSEQEKVKDYVEKLGYTFITKKLLVTKESETQLRALRYESFKKIALNHNIEVVLTAHHLDDQAETFFMQMIRSGSTIGVSGINKISSKNNLKYYRPLLSFSKKELAQYAFDHEVPFFEDETNLSDETIRNQIRHHVFNNDILSNQQKRHFLNFCKNFNELKNDTYSYYDKLINENKTYSNNIGTIAEVKCFHELEEISLRNFLSYFLLKNGVSSVKERLIDEFIELLLNNGKPQGFIKISNRIILYKEYDRFGLKDTISNKRKDPPDFHFDRWYVIGNEEVGVFSPKEIENQEYKKKFFVSFADDDPPLIWRYRENGDLILNSGQIKKKLRRFFIEKKVPDFQRNSLLILASGQNILYLEKFGYSGLFNTDKTDKITSVVLLR